MPSQRHIERRIYGFFWWLVVFAVLAGLNHLFGWWKTPAQEAVPSATNQVRKN